MVNPISCIRDFSLEESCVDFSGDESISNCFFQVALAICFLLIGMGLPSAVAKVACRFLVDLLVAVAGGVCFNFVALVTVRWAPLTLTTNHRPSQGFCSFPFVLLFVSV